MADITGEFLASGPLYGELAGSNLSGDLTVLGDIHVPPGPTATSYYKMRAQDSGSEFGPRYITWIVQDEPDFAGVGYSGGEPTPVGAMVPGSAIVATEWEEPV